MNRQFVNALLSSPLRDQGDATLLLLRMTTGAFLVWGVLDNILSAERMLEFEHFLASFGFPLPALMAPLSVWAQFLVGLCFIAGFITRWAGIVCAVNFVVAIVMVDAAGGIRAAFPSACLVLIGLHLAAVGAGAFSVDRRIEKASMLREGLAAD